MSVILKYFLLFGIFLKLSSCDPGNEPITQDACERLKTESSCRKRGCLWASYQRSIEVDGQCAAFGPGGPICLAAGDSVNNITMEIYRKADTGTDFAFLGNGYLWVLGWMGLEEYIQTYGPWSCGPEPAACEAQTDRDGCERLYCYWAEDVRVGVVEGDACTGWEPEPVSMCLTPYPYLAVGDGQNSFEVGAQIVRRYVPLAAGPRVYEFRINPSSPIWSKENDEPVYWQTCYMQASSQPAICHCGD